MTEKTRKEPRRQARGQRSAPTIADVARIASCSPMTVSRVINGDSNVRETTRERVRAAITQLNYAPNRAARSLAGADQMRLGLLYSNPSAAYLSEFLVGSLDQASRSDVQLVVEKCEFGVDEVAPVRHMMKNGVDGIILPSPLCDSGPVVQLLMEEGVPAVLVGSGKPNPALAAVSIDEYGAARQMTRHIIGLGHRRIGFIIGNPHQSASERRLLGFVDEMRASNLDASEELMVQGLFTYRSGLDAATRLLNLQQPPTAVFASNDDMAAATIAVAHRRHLDVPADLTVCGYDDTFIASTIWPELTTVRQPIQEMARAGVELLVSLVRDKRAGKKTPPTHVMLDHTFVRRQSDAAPALARRLGLDQR